MRRLIFLIAIPLGLSTTVLLAADFWLEKDFAEWNENEVDRMLTNSPWAKSVQVSIGGQGAAGLPGGGAGRGRGGRPGGGGMPGVGDASSGGMPSGGGRRGGGMPRGGMSAPPTMKFFLRWISATPVRQALARLNCGTELDSECAKRLLEFEDDRYILYIAGLPNRMLRAGSRGGRRGDPEQTGPPSEEQMQARRQQMVERLTENSTLRAKGKEPLHPNLVQIGDGPAPDIYLFFPKSNDGGWDIVSDDKSIEFEMQLPNNKIRQKFKPKDMMYDGKLEI